MRKTIFWCFVIVIASFLSRATSAADDRGSDLNSSSQAQIQQEFERDAKRLQALYTSLDLAKFQEVVDDIDAKWSEREGSYYAKLKWMACGFLSEYAGGKGPALADRYALITLQKAKEMDAALELNFALCLQVPRRQIKDKDEDWTKQRKERATLWLRAWKHLRSEIKPNFDLTNPPAWNAPLPPGVPIAINGLPSEAISDPKLRAEYEKLIEEHNKQVQEYSKQSYLRDLEKTFRDTIEKRTIAVYSKPPFDIEELKKLIDDSISDQKMISKILDTVRKNMVARQLQPPSDALPDQKENK